MSQSALLIAALPPVLSYKWVLALPHQIQRRMKQGLEILFMVNKRTAIGLSATDFYFGL